MNPSFRHASRGLLAPLALLLALAAPARAATPIQTWTQPNGAKVYLVASPSIPMVDVQVDFDAGGRRDPAAQAGLASVTAGMTSRGILARDGQPALDENAVSEAWTDLGGSFGASAGPERMSFTLRSLTAPDILPKAAQLAARQMGEPAFPDDVWQRERDRGIAALKEANTRPGVIAGRAFSAAVYGNHPYGYEATEATLSRIATADMRRLYAERVRPCRAKVSIVGALNRQQAADFVTTLLGRLPQDCPAAVDQAIPDVQPLTAAKEERIAFPAAQAQVLIGQPGYKRADPDHFALFVGNYILGGGGFASRLTNEVREKRGLTYGVYSGFSPGLQAGAFSVTLQTRPDQADAALAITREVLAKFVTEGPTETELKAAKDNLVGGFPLLLDTNRKLLANIANMAWYDLPLDYLDTWTQKVNAITVGDVKAAFARKLDPSRMATIVLGPAP